MKSVFALAGLAALVFLTGSNVSSYAQATQEGRTAKCIARCQAECDRRNPGGDSGRKSACMNVCQRNYQC